MPNAARRLRWDTRNKRPNDLMECFTVPLLCKWLIRLSSCSPLGTASKINDFYLIFEWIRSRKSFWATLWATSRKTRVAGRCHDARRQHDATIAPKRFSELMIESTRQATRDRNSACSPGASGAAVDCAHPPPDSRFRTIAVIAGFWRELVRSNVWIRRALQGKNGGWVYGLAPMYQASCWSSCSGLSWKSARARPD